MKIAFTTKGTTWDSAMDPRFGRTEYFLVYDEDKDELSNYDNSSVEKDAHGAGPKTAQKLYELGAGVLIRGIDYRKRPGRKRGKRIRKNRCENIYRCGRYDC